MARWLGRPRASLGGPMRHTLLTRGPRVRRRRRSPVWGWLGGVLLAAGIVTYWYFVFGVMDPADERKRGSTRRESHTSSPPEARPGRPRREPIDPTAVLHEHVHRTARGMVASGVRWEGGYTPLAYPGGDVARDRCTSVDILVRALRGANIDLQVLIHEDRVAHPERYPLHRWKQTAPDPSIDHRRLANVWAFFNRYAVRLDAGVGPRSLEAYRPGDIVFWGEGKMEVPSHVGIVDDRHTGSGVPYVIDLDRDVRELSDAHALTYRPLMGHFRIDIDRLPEPLGHTSDPGPEEP